MAQVGLKIGVDIIVRSLSGLLLVQHRRLNSLLLEIPPQLLMALDAKDFADLPRTAISERIVLQQRMRTSWWKQFLIGTSMRGFLMQAAMRMPTLVFGLGAHYYLDLRMPTSLWEIRTFLFNRTGSQEWGVY